MLKTHILVAAADDGHDDGHDDDDHGVVNHLVYDRFKTTYISFNDYSEMNKEYMEQECRKSCGFCNGGDGYQARQCLDLAVEGEIQCREWAWHGEWYVPVAMEWRMMLLMMMMNSYKIHLVCLSQGMMNLTKMCVCFFFFMMPVGIFHKK